MLFYKDTIIKDGDYEQGGEIMPYCKNCGNLLRENAKFCDNCGNALDNNQEKTCDNHNKADENVNERKQEWAGKIVKCPNCGEILKSFTARCPSCAFEINTTQKVSSFDDFLEKIKQCDLSIKADYKKRKEIFPEEIEKATLIKNYSFPNEREALLEALTYVRNQLADISLQKVNKKTQYWTEIWCSKAEQLYYTIGLLINGDEMASKIYNDINATKEEINTKIKKDKKRLFVTVLIVIVIFIIIGAAADDDEAKDNQKRSSKSAVEYVMADFDS